MGLYALVLVSSTLCAQAAPPKRAQPTVFKTAPATKAPTSKATLTKPGKPASKKPASKPGKKAAKKATPVEPPPKACKAAVDSVVTLTSGGLELLVAEIRKREDSNLDDGQAAFEAYLTEKLPEIDAARAAAATLEAGLSEKERGRCDTYAFSAFHKMMVRYASVTSAYHSRIWIFRQLGAAFQ
ncbi:MAG: hypothetical protein ACI9OJ_004443 [Myxococcota bacterium]|jgi:hypothetical protein